MKLNERIKKNFKVYFTILLLSSFLFLYQNCGQPLSVSEKDTSTNTETTSEANSDQNKKDQSTDLLMEEKISKKSSNLPQSFFAIHFEPRSGNNENFKYLENLINDADTYKVKLTLQFTPTWAKMILADSSKLNLIRKWQKNGHEIAAHHHGANIGLDADGYTSLTQSEYDETRKKVYASASASSLRTQDQARNSDGKAEDYQGTMEDFVNILKKLVGAKNLNLITIPSSTDRDADWMNAFIYSIDNIQYHDNGFTILDGAKATPEYVEYGGNDVVEMEMQYLEDNDAVETAKTDHGSSGSSEIIGVITHIEDYMTEKSLALSWMKYLQSKDANGSRNKTVSEILNKWKKNNKKK